MRNDEYECDVSIIIVSYNTIEKTRRCIESINCLTKEVTYTIIVSDNGSEDGTIEMIKKEYPEVVLLENNSNLGFGKANNLALSKARGKYILFLNSDTYLKNNAIKLFFDYWENNNKKNIGALGAALINPEGQYIHSGSSFPTYKTLCKRQLIVSSTAIVKFLAEILHLQKAIKSVRKERDIRSAKKVRFGEIDYITGADLFMRNSELAKFNEQYFMYNEETELELNLSKKNLSRVLIDGPQIVHDQHKKNNNMHEYSIVDAYKDMSGIIYAKNNLCRRAILLKGLFSILLLVPQYRGIIRQARKISAESIKEYKVKIN